MTVSGKAGAKLGPFLIRPGLSRGNARTVLAASFTTIAMVVFMSLIQPYVLNEIVQIPEARQGKVTGFLTTMQETIVICLAGFVGAWSDRVGRRLVYALGFGLLAGGYFIYSMATKELDLYLYRAMFAAGIALATVMLSTSVQDTPQEVSRGKWIGTNNLCQGIGVLLLATVLLGRAPGLLVGAGIDQVTAGRMTLWGAAAICALSGLVVWRGLPGRKPGPAHTGTIFSQFKAGTSYALRNPRLALALGAAFVGRGDLVIVGNFFTLWITQSGIEAGMTTAQASGRAFMLFGIAQIAALAWAFFMGVIADRLNRVTSLCIAMGVAAVGYSLVGMQDDPFDGLIIPLAILLGIGEVSIIVASGALLGQEARSELRGAIVGVFNTFGGLGIMVVSFAGGIIYDAIGKTAPFAVMGILNAALLAVALLVRLQAGSPDPDDGRQRTTR